MQRAPEGIRMHQIRFAPGLRPDPTGELTTLPDPLVGWEGYPLPMHTLPLDAFGVSISAHSAPVCLPPTYFSFPRA